jgi:adenosylhomocysteine nucleosidase
MTRASIPAGGGQVQWDFVIRRKWLVLTALSMEAKAIEAELGGSLDQVGMQSIGIRAEQFKREMLDGFDGMILAGLAGALDPSLKIGDVVVDLGAGPDSEALPGYRERGIRLGRIFSADHLIGTAAEKGALFKTTGCLAVEMEGEVVRAAAESAGVRMIHVRAVSDTADQQVPVWVMNCIDGTGRARPGSVIGGLARHPLQWAALVRLGRQTRLAAARMAAAVRWIVQSGGDF